MSQETRVPLSAVPGYAEGLREEELPREGRLGQPETIQRSGDHRLRTILEDPRVFAA